MAITKILFISGREPGYMRNAMMLKSLKESGFEVIECTSSSTSYLIRYPKILVNFILKRKTDFDLIYIGYFGQPLVPLIKKLSDKPIIFDAFLSAYDTMCFDRKRFSPNSIFGKFFYWIDKHSCELANLVLLDTNAHIDYFVKTFGIEREKFKKVYMGADDSIFYPIETVKDSGKFKIFYYSTYHPLHGVEYIIRAAKKLDSYKDIEFEIVGRGMEYKKIKKLAHELDVKNVKFTDKIPFKYFYETVKHKIAEADVCLGGHFSSIDKGKRTISEKTFEFIAMKKPVIIGDNPANKELFEHRINAMLVEMANADALADAILELKKNDSMREPIAESGYKIFIDQCTPHAIAKDIKKIMGA